MTTFAALGTPKAIADALAADGIEEAFPIQVKTLPDTLAGRDVLGRGRTGSGKTIAFAIPLVARFAEREGKHMRKPGRPTGPPGPGRSKSPSASRAAPWASSLHRRVNWRPRSTPPSSRWPRPWA